MVAAEAAYNERRNQRNARTGRNKAVWFYAYAAGLGGGIYGVGIPGRVRFGDMVGEIVYTPRKK